MSVDMDDDAIKAVVDLGGRTGATGFEIGYLHDDVPVDQAGWYAHVQLRGTRILVEDCKGPTEAAEALSRRLLSGAQCQGCKGLVALSSAGAMSYGSTFADGRTWSSKEQAAARQCHWRRIGARWEMGCEPDRIIESIHQALRERDTAAVPRLLLRLALHDPKRAENVLDAIEAGIRINPGRQTKP